MEQFGLQNYCKSCHQRHEGVLLTVSITQLEIFANRAIFLRFYTILFTCEAWIPTQPAFCYPEISRSSAVTLVLQTTLSCLSEFQTYWWGVCWRLFLYKSIEWPTPSFCGSFCCAKLRLKIELSCAFYTCKSFQCRLPGICICPAWCKVRDASTVEGRLLKKERKVW